MTVPEHVIIGTRGSDLALWQAHWVERELQRLFPGIVTTIEIIKTTGDKILDSPLSKIGDKGLFTREIEQALLRKDVDLAVHSLKDLPTQLPEGLMIGAIAKREDVRDVFIPHPSNPIRTLMDQKPSARIATGSLRRRCQLLSLRRDVEVVDIRGNLNTRLRKLEESDWAGMLLARAGVVRLGWEDRIGETLAAETMLPAVGQGALAVEIREGDSGIGRIVSRLNHWETATATRAERSLLRTLEGGCQIPIGTYGRIERDQQDQTIVVLDAVVGSLDGRHLVRGKIHGDPDDAEELGSRLARTLVDGGAGEILRAIRNAQTSS